MLSCSRSHLADHVLLRTDIAAGRLHLTAVVLLKPYLTAENVDDLLCTAAGKTKAKVELLIAERFPKADVPTTLAPFAVSSALAPARNDVLASTAAPEQFGASRCQQGRRTGSGTSGS